MHACARGVFSEALVCKILGHFLIVQGDIGEKTGLWTFAINQFINTSFFTAARHGHGPYELREHDQTKRTVNPGTFLEKCSATSVLRPSTCRLP